MQRQVDQMRSHDTLRAEIARTAIQTFLRNGFEQTTVDDIAAAAGISRRTYFRYFASKDESLLTGMQELGIAIADAFRSTPPATPPLVALRDAFLEVERSIAEYADRQRAIAGMLRTNPRLHGALLMVQRERIDEFTEVLGSRRGEEHSTDRLTAHMAMDAWNLAVERWLADPDTTLRDQAVRSFAELMSLVPEQGAVLSS